MKTSKRIIAAVLMVMMLASVMVLPAAAADVDWCKRISTFKEISKSTGGSAPGYTIPLQNFLSEYRDDYCSILAQAGGIDGNFGQATEKCVRDYQDQRGLKVDGFVGSKTWYAIGENLEDEFCNVNIKFKVGNTYIINSSLTSPYKFYYYVMEAGNLTIIPFHTTY